MFEKRLKAVDLAKGTNIAPSVISRYLSGQNQPSRDNIITIGNYLDAHPQSLLSSSDAPESSESSRHIPSDKDKIIDVQDKDGAKYDFKKEGNVTKEKVLKIFELMDLINIEEDQAPNLDSVGGKIWNVTENSFPTGRFTSSEVLEKYEDEYNEPIKLSVVSTYLARFASRNRIERTRTGREWSYQLIRIAQKHP